MKQTDMTEKVKPLSSLGSDIQLLISILKCSSLITIPMEGEVSEPNDLTRHEMKVLVCLSGEGTLTGQEISQLMSMPAMNVSRALSNLHERGWLELVDDAGNRRRRPFRISAKGWRQYNAMLPEFRSVAERLFALLNKKDRRELQRLVNLLNDQLDNWAELADAEAKKKG
ncbi:MarR family winged helix-turn-helix transcriptional regulator [Hyphococcus luteus]|nr:MarR family winged helix-turn-helix transcriptional regulator [Marinicaulis flavus]